jgi:hypothetical protein
MQGGKFFRSPAVGYPAGLPSVRKVLGVRCMGVDERKCAPVVLSKEEAKIVDTLGKLRRARYRRRTRDVTVHGIVAVGERFEQGLRANLCRSDECGENCLPGRPEG